MQLMLQAIPPSGTAGTRTPLNQDMASWLSDRNSGTVFVVTTRDHGDIMVQAMFPTTTADNCWPMADEFDAMAAVVPPGRTVVGLGSLKFQGPGTDAWKWCGHLSGAVVSVPESLRDAIVRAFAAVGLRSPA